MRITPRVAIQLLAFCLAAGMPPPRGVQAATHDDGELRLRADTRVVQVDVSVLDSVGKPVEDLKQSDFTITDNGKPRPFTIFTSNVLTSNVARGRPETPPIDRPTLPPNTFTNAGAPARLPGGPEGHSTIILLDAMSGYFENFVWARQGVVGLMTKIPPDERLALYVLQNGAGLGLLHDYTTDRTQLTDALARYKVRTRCPSMCGAPVGMEGFEDMNEFARPHGPPGRPTAPGPTAPPNASKPNPREAAAATLGASDAVRLSLQALAEKLRTTPGRKTVFWVTQGFPPVQLRDMNKPGWDKTFAALNDANIAVNTVDDNGLGGPPRLAGPGAVSMMQQVADQTGGTAYFHRNDLDVAIASGIADSRQMYSLGFYLTELDGKYHDLKVSANRPGLQLNYRQGYYARSEAAQDLAAKNADLQAALLNPVDSASVGITANIEITPGTPRASMTAHLKLVPESLSFKETPGGWTGAIEELFLEWNAAGREVGRLSDRKQFEIDTAHKSALDASGVILSQAIPLPAEAVKLSIVVRDTASGRVGSLTIPLEKVARSGVP